VAVNHKTQPIRDENAERTLSRFMIDNPEYLLLPPLTVPVTKDTLHPLHTQQPCIAGSNNSGSTSTVPSYLSSNYMAYSPASPEYNSIEASNNLSRERLTGATADSLHCYNYSDAEIDQCLESIYLDSWQNFIPDNDQCTSRQF